MILNYTDQTIFINYNQILIIILNFNLKNQSIISLLLKLNLQINNLNLLFSQEQIYKMY
jgi:hypothetical protein